MPRVSVVVATYNQTQVLKWLLKSLEEQDFADFEVLVCDDGSSENTQGVVDACAKRGTLDLLYLRQPHKGNRVTRSMNNGIRCARGEILLFVDSDCVVPRDWISTHVRAHRDGKKKIVGGTRRWIDLETARKKSKNLDELFEAGREHGSYLDLDRQRALGKSRLPWAGCWSFNFSITNGPEVFFDEKAQWGSYDYELGCRLFHRHGYTASLKRNLEVLHVSLPKLVAGWNPWVSEKPEHIERYVRGLVYLAGKFPEVDLAEALWPLHFFRVDSKTGKWRKARPEKGERVSLPVARVLAETWINERL